MTAAPVVLYGHKGCPGTDRARRYFRSRGVPVAEKDIFDPAVTDEWKGLRAWATPVIVIGGVKRIGFDERICEELLKGAT